MIVDSSALLAIILEEPEADATTAAIAGTSVRRISAGNWLETTIVVDGRRSPVASARFEQLIARLGIEVVRSNHPARLNFGDCMSYTLAQAHGEPLLFKGNDFSRTDITPALRP